MLGLSKLTGAPCAEQPATRATDPNEAVAVRAMARRFMCGLRWLRSDKKCECMKGAQEDAGTGGSVRPPGARRAPAARRKGWRRLARSVHNPPKGTPR
ncbi:hypothetical protein GCM10020367_36600 [Streptomyces sannanensis]|uniref:Transposase n=1 Tax=Streptomyces sannanensis TaxID=285536 RepID=A0ABP6SE69_9ACTN